MTIQNEYYLLDCGPLNNPSYGSVDTSAGTNYSSVAVYECNPGYYVDGSSRRQCQDTGSWSGSAPICRMHGKCHRF